MAQASEIEWTDATWNPVTGCTKIGPGCDNCYASRFAERWRGIDGHPYEQGFDLRLWPDRLEQPLRWKKPRLIFVNSMSDLFHKDVPVSYINSVFETMESADQHVFQVLTKRSSLLRKYINQRYQESVAPDHIWLGVSVEDREHSSRIEHLKQANASIRFVSFEPLLGPIGKVNLGGIAWAIVGGESGPKARPMDPKWARELRDQCLRQDVSFFFKQWGGPRPKSGGRTLDGEIWDGFPVHRMKKPMSEMFARS
ncbi:phage Gp37/Gp68 family protein [Nisaea acidiphila]|uniref:Phage Gp37/Gp68 family protein n=1 Tax=Nisaea acidiphila TaxID=1862145 RepID=A0A9J7ASZ4_9PROT|nr:phage Gp37/Gp68 family protein [Nisaea acidiphila]UUX48485.1 phage Gp37/Gp68 family protein [Nisaea acidiphila]